MSLVIWDFYKGMNELILTGDNRRLKQLSHNIKRGFTIIFTLGFIIPKYMDYYKKDANVSKTEQGKRE